MPKKDTSANVLGMLSTAGSLHRPAAAVAPAPAQDTVSGQSEQDARVVDLTPPEPPSETRSPAQRPRSAPEPVEPPAATQIAPAPPEAVSPAKPTEDNAPRTHRLDQTTANNLRAGWLATRRRGEVTISQQEYAGRIIALGLAVEARQLDE